MQTEKEKNIEINFNSFLSIIGLEKIVNVIKPNPKLGIIKQADFLLKTHNYETYVDMLSKGYEPTKKQEEMMNNYINSVLSLPCEKALVGYMSLENLLNKGLQLNYNNVSRFLHNDYFELNTSSSNGEGGLYYNENLLFEPNYVINAYYEATYISKSEYQSYEKRRKQETFPLLTKQICNTMNQPEFSDYFLEGFKKCLNTKFAKSEPGRNMYGQKIHDSTTRKERSAKHTMRRYREVLKYAPEILFRNTSYEQVTQLIEKMQHTGIYKDEKTTLNNIINNLYKKDVSKLLGETQANYSSNMLKNLTIENIRNEQYNMRDLPKSATIIIENIEETYKKIKENNFDEPDKINQLNNLLEKRLPEVLTKYLKVDPEYRKTLKSSQGKNAEDLMIDSLHNIKDSFITVFEEINQNTVNSLSATNRYTKSLKM